MFVEYMVVKKDMMSITDYTNLVIRVILSEHQNVNIKIKTK